MKLITLMILGFLFIQECEAGYGYHTVQYILSKYDSKNIYKNEQAVCVDLNDYKDDKYIYFAITLYDGWFYSTDQYIYYGTFNDYPRVNYDVYLNSREDYYSYTYDSYYTSYYDKYTLKYEIKKPSSERYLCVAPPYFYKYYTYSSHVEIKNVSSFGLSVAVIVVIVIACIAIVAASIIVYFCRRARRASYIAPPVAEYQPPVATAYPPPTYY